VKPGISTVEDWNYCRIQVTQRELAQIANEKVPVSEQMEFKERERRDKETGRSGPD
jgi:hypothetical protein